MNVAFSMTIDPDGAMHDWVDAPPGVTLVRVPTQEAVTLLGFRAYQELLVELCAAERVGLLVTHPPYDYLDEPTAERLRAGGTRILGYAFDDEIFADKYGAGTRAALARVYDRYVTTREVPWATAPLPAIPERQAEHDVVLVGRAYARRAALVERLRAAGVNVVVKGAGWESGVIPRAQMLDLYARAAVVLTTADWENWSVPMIKHRLLDTAMLGAFQIAQAAPDLRRYFPEEEVPSFADPEELVEKIEVALADPQRRRAAARAARERALREHTWAARWPILVGDLPIAEADATAGRSRLLDQLLLALGSRAEADGRTPAAAALFGELLARVPDEPAAAAGLGRCLRDLGRTSEAIGPLRIAAAARPPVCLAALAVGIPQSGVGTGFGRLSLTPPAAEPLCFLIASLVELGRDDEALAVARDLTDPVLVDAVTSGLGGDLPPELKDVLAERMETIRAGR